MKKQERNLMVLENFILHLTHTDDDTDNKKESHSPKDLYEAVRMYIKEDWSDGEGAED